MISHKDMMGIIATEAAEAVAGSTGYRLNDIKARQNERQLQECDQMLTEAGVPEWVLNCANEPVPANSTPQRLKWYLARRKNVSKWEIDRKLQRDMADALRWARAMRNDGD